MPLVIRHISSGMLALQPLSNKLGDGLPSLHQSREILVPRRVHVGTMGCSLDENGRQSFRDVAQNSKRVPGIDGAVGKDNVCDILGYVSASVVGVGVVHRLVDGRGIDVVDFVTDVSGEVEGHQMAKRLVGGVGSLEVCKLCTGLVEPLPLWRRELGVSD